MLRTLVEFATIVALGFAVGLVARVLVPGRQHIGCLPTIAVGVLGGFIGALLGRAFAAPVSRPVATAVFTVLGALAVLAGFEQLLKRRQRH